MNRHLIDPKDPIHDLLERDRRYRFEGYQFVLEGLEFAQRKALAQAIEDEEAAYEPGEGDLDEEDEEEGHHVSGQQLCTAIREYALDQFGMTAKCVLQHWGIHTTRDIGEIVFNMIKIKKMKKTARDRIEDFDDVFDFEEAFRPGFRATMPKSSEGKWA